MAVTARMIFPSSRSWTSMPLTPFSSAAKCGHRIWLARTSVTNFFAWLSLHPGRQHPGRSVACAAASYAFVKQRDGNLARGQPPSDGETDDAAPMMTTRGLSRIVG